MRTTGNTVFITGGSSGIGRGLAGAFYERGNQVIISGRRRERMESFCATHPGMRYFELDVTCPEAIGDVAGQVIAAFPALNCVVNNAGVQRNQNFAPGNDLDECALADEIGTNLLGPIRVTAAFLPHLAGQPGATLVNVSSGLAFVPMASFPVYCATKAALHSWTLSLRHQLRGTGVEVIEILPPWVATELGGSGKSSEPETGRGPMPIDAFIAETMRALESGRDELPIAESQNLANAAGANIVRHVFSNMNR